MSQIKKNMSQKIMKINVTKNEIAKELSDYFGFSNLYSKEH